MYKSILLPREKYNESANKWGKSPIMMEIKNDKQVLFYFGANHSRNPEDSQYPALREYWDKFIEKTKDKNKVVLIEGGLRKLSADDTETKAIEHGAEAGLITILANIQGVAIESPDINESDMFDLLKDSVQRDEFLLLWFLIWFDNFQRFPEPKPDFDKFFESWKERQSKRALWEGLDLSFQSLRDLYKRIIGREFNEKEDQNILIDPNKFGARTNEIVRMQSDLREERVVSEIVRHWNLGESIFVVFGNGHLIIQEPALKILLK